MPPERDDDLELERVVGRALRRLPPPRAPRTLLPRVIAAAAGRIAPRPWYTRAWLTWPRGWQAASVAALAVMVAGVAWLSPQADGAIDGLVALAGPLSARAAAVLQGADLVASIARVVWRALLLPAAVIGFALALGLALAGGACWTVINRVALSAGRASPS
jgi:hypothetical protein